jgi:hypothetical protein
MLRESARTKRMRTVAVGSRYIRFKPSIDDVLIGSAIGADKLRPAHGFIEGFDSAHGTLRFATTHGRRDEDG